MLIRTRLLFCIAVAYFMPYDAFGYDPVEYCQPLRLGYIHLQEPTDSVLAAFQKYEKDSLHLIDNPDCRLIFYNNYVYLHRRLEKNDQALQILDSLDYEIKDVNPLYHAQSLLEKSLILFYSLDPSASEYLDSLKHFAEQNNYYRDAQDSLAVMSLYSISSALYSNAEEYEESDRYLKLKMERAGDNSFAIFHNYFMLGLNNLNSSHFHSSYDYLLKADEYRDKPNINNQMRNELDVLLGSTLTSLDSFEQSRTYLNRALQSSDRKVVKTYAIKSLMEGFTQQDHIDSLLKYEVAMKELVNEEQLDENVKLDVIYYLSVLCFNRQDMKCHQRYFNQFVNGMDTSRLYHRYVHAKFEMQDYVLKHGLGGLEVLSRFNKLNKLYKNEKNTTNINSWNVKYESEKKDIQNKLLQSENERKDGYIQRLWIGGSSVGVLALLLLGLLWYRNKSLRQEQELAELSAQQLKNANRTLSSQLKDLKKHNTDKNSKNGANGEQEPLSDDLQLTLPLKGEEVTIGLHRIVYIKSAKNYIDLYIEGQNRPITYRSSLKGFQKDWLPQNVFRRVHKSYVVNTNYIKERLDNKLILKYNQKSVPVDVGTKYASILNEKDVFANKAVM